MKDFVIKQLIGMKFDEFNNFDKLENKFKQILQELILYSLYRTGFYNFVAFHGGTALRIFYKLNRFSEDLDFALTRDDKDFNLNDYFNELENNLKSFGLSPTIIYKKYGEESSVQRCYIKFNTLNELKRIFPEMNFSSKHKDAITSIKIDVDTKYIKYGTTCNIVKQWPLPFVCNLFDTETLFAGKLHAILCRGWKTRVKGRDLYDYLYYMSMKSKFNINYLREKLILSGVWKGDLTIDDVKLLLTKKFNELDYDNAKRDLLLFVSDIKLLEKWSSSYFIKTLDNLKNI